MHLIAKEFIVIDTFFFTNFFFRSRCTLESTYPPTTVEAIRSGDSTVVASANNSNEDVLNATKELAAKEEGNNNNKNKNNNNNNTTENELTNVQDEAGEIDSAGGAKKDIRFWAIIASVS